LRTWERRYGVPVPERSDYGHRRYSLATVEKLRLVRAAMQAGHRASLVLRATDAELRLLVVATKGLELRPPPAGSNPATDTGSTVRWIELIRRFDGVALERELHAGLAGLGALAFLEHRVAPLMREIGECWQRSDVGVCHEHYASERLQSFLSKQWRPLSDIATGPIAICATPAGELHSVGLQMAAFTLALNNLRVVYLGADLPASELAFAARYHEAAVIVLSATCGAAQSRIWQECADLRRVAGSNSEIVVGGAGFPEAPPDTLRLEDLFALDEWAQALTRTEPGPEA
jgi:methanogenic corrinoid protein MtbC1